jgi:hypothetical protein
VPDGLWAASQSQSKYSSWASVGLLTTCAEVCTILDDVGDIGAGGAGLNTAIANAIAEVLHTTQTSGVGRACAA